MVKQSESDAAATMAATGDAQAIDLDDDDNDDDADDADDDAEDKLDDDEVNVVEKAIPAAIYGSVSSAKSSDEPTGAKARFAKRKRDE